MLLLLGSTAFFVSMFLMGGFDPTGAIDWLQHISPRRSPPTEVRPVLAPHSIARNASDSLPAGRLGTDASASKVPLRLILVRTIQGPNVHSGAALIGSDPQHPQTFLASAILENGARIDEIYHDRIVLMKDGRRTTLYVLGLTSPDESVTTDPPLTVGGMSASSAPVQPSVEQATDYVRPVPVYEQGAVVGFQVYPGRHSEAFTRWGLQSGDVIVALDGQPLTDADQVMHLFHLIVEGASMTASVQRNGVALAFVTLDGEVIQQEGAFAAPDQRER